MGAARRALAADGAPRAVLPAALASPSATRRSRGFFFVFREVVLSVARGCQRRPGASASRCPPNGGGANLARSPLSLWRVPLPGRPVHASVPSEIGLAFYGIGEMDSEEQPGIDARERRPAERLPRTRAEPNSCLGLGQPREAGFPRYEPGLS